MTLREFLNSREFYELMQTYRHQPIQDFVEVSENFENIKKSIIEYDASREKAIEGMREALNKALNYLNWRTDDLCGDDLIGDGKLTQKFNRQLDDIQEALAAFEKVR